MEHLCLVENPCLRLRLSPPDATILKDNLANNFLTLQTNFHHVKIYFRKKELWNHLEVYGGSYFLSTFYQRVFFKFI